jgi:hypothetical protein
MSISTFPVETAVEYDGELVDVYQLINEDDDDE